MSTDFNNWLNFDLKKSVPFDNIEEVDGIARRKLASEIQRNIRTRIDPGVNRSASGDGVAVDVDGHRFVIKADNAADVLRVTSKQVGNRSEQADAGSVDDLFEQSSGVPKAHTRPDGSTGISFQRITIASILSEQKASEQKAMIEQTVTDTVRNGIVNAYEEGFSEVSRKNPGES